MTAFTIIDEGKPRELTATVEGSRAFISPDDLSAALGWQLKPEGLCRDAACYPVPPSLDLVVDNRIDLESFAALIGRPLAMSIEHRVAALGTSAEARADSMESLAAPDFTLPDLNGRMHSLSEHRGKKVFLVAHASW
jgi:hypothetical protein